MTVPADLTVLDVREATVADIDALVEVERALEAEQEADWPPIGPEEQALWLFQFPESKPQRTWIATADGRTAGYLKLYFPAPYNSFVVGVQAGVRPDHRRRGVASALASSALAEVPAGRTTTQSFAEQGAGAIWCGRLGMTVRQIVRQSRLRLAECDLDGVRTWMRPALAADAGYHVISWRGPCPDELVDRVAAARSAMADTPHDELEHEDAPLTADRIRDDEQSRQGRTDMFAALALAADGLAAGFTELGVNVHRPTLGFQGDTVVVAAHRGHRLGRWLKAANLLHALEVHPSLAELSTNNAESNPWMLAINDAMGYRPHRTYLVHQGTVDDARTHVGPPR